MRAALAFPVLVFTLGACYSTPTPECAFLCGADSACPGGYACASDGWCKRADLPDDFVCQARPADAAVVDGPVDGGIDAAADAAVDGAPDATPTCGASLSPSNDGSSAPRRALVLSELAPGQHVEVFNATNSAIALDGRDFRLVSGDEVVVLDAAGIGAGVTIAAGGFAALGWPASFTAPVAAGGEVLLYLDADLADDDKIMDFVCWGDTPTVSRKASAEAGGKWTVDEACPAALAMGAIHRLTATTGLDAASYDVTGPPSPTTCAP
jgi:hypothetical protein